MLSTRRIFFYTVGLIVSLVTLIMFEGVNAAALNDEIHWTITGPNSVTIDWRGPSNTIKYGTTTAYGQVKTASTPAPLPFSSSGPFWEAKLTNLQPNTVYHYSIGSDPDHTFRTAPAKGSSGFVVDVIGDVGDTTSYSNMGPIQSMIAADRPNFVIVVGDLTYGNNHGQATVDQHFKDVQVWSLGSTAYMPAWGNHEWDIPNSDDLRNYKGRFDFPNPQTSPGSPSVSCCGEDWYYFDYGNTRFISYPEPWSGALSDWNTKAKAIMDAAQADSSIAFIVTYGHRPAYSSGHHPGESTLKSYLDGLGATHSKYVLNLNGHSHDYERTLPQSHVVHITAGVGGSGLEQDGSCLWLICTKPSWSAKRFMHQGVVKLTFGASSIQGAFICGPAGGGTNDITCSQGQAIDTFSIGGSGPTPTPGSSTATPTRTPTPGATATRTVTAGPTAIYTATRTPLGPTATFTPTLAAGTISTLTFPVIADSYVRQAGPTSNYGTNAQLWVANETNANYETYLKFTVSGVVGTVQSATLRVYSTSSTVDGPSVYAAASSWTETGITWNTRPALTSGGMDNKGSISTGVWVQYNVTPLVTANGTYTFALRTTTGTDSVSFSSREGSQPPQLILNIAP